MPVNPLVNLFPALFLFGVMYFLLIRPQQRRQQEHTKLLAALKKHDEVVTAGGLHGTILQVKEQTVTLRIDDAVKVELDKTAVARVTRRAVD